MNLKIETSCILPPQIQQRFDEKFLSYPCPSFRQTSKDLMEFFMFYKTIAYKKCKSGKIPAKKAKCDQLIAEFLELYEWIKIKEKKREKEESHFTQRPFYSFKIIDLKSEVLYGRFRIRQFQNRFSN